MVQRVSVLRNETQYLVNRASITSAVSGPPTADKLHASKLLAKDEAVSGLREGTSAGSW